MNRIDMLPVIIGAGQDSRPVPDDLDTAFGPADLAAEALSRAFADAGLSPRPIDSCYAVRLFADSGPAFPNPFGGSNNFPASVCARAGVTAAEHVYGPVGGQSPQTLLARIAKRLMDGEIGMAALVGGEAIANIKAAIRAGASPDMSEEREEPLQDMGAYPDGEMPVHMQAIMHRIAAPAHYYALMESARRAAMGTSKADYRQHMGNLLESFAKVATANPFAAIRTGPDADAIATPGSDNPLISGDYTKAMVARDRVNLGAALLVTTYGHARALGARDVTFLHAYSAASEPVLLTRPRIDRSDAQRHVLEQAGRDADLYDLYSCFPIVPSEAQSILGPTGVCPTLTGGLPFFGGPGNNYSLHAIAEAHARIRGQDKVAVIYANGGMSSKHAVGRYAGIPPESVEWGGSAPEITSKFVETASDPSGTILGYTVEYARGEPVGIVILAETADGARFYARAGTDHALTFIEGNPIGLAIRTESRAGQNLLTGI